MDESILKERFRAFVAHKMPAVSDIAIEAMERIHGGASRETFRIALSYRFEGEPVSLALILRLGMDASLIETEMAGEFNAYQAFFNTDVPVPKMHWLEEDRKWLDNPFLVMEEIPDCESSPELIAAEPYAAVRDKIGVRFCRIMGCIARIDPAEIDIFNHLEMPAPSECWKKELQYWEGVIDQDELEPQPVARAAIRWLKKHPPPPAQKISVVHGDYRIGNILYDRDGDIRAILDWEMCHPGDPLEDLGFALNPLWSIAEPDKLGMMLPRNEAVSIWQEESGLAAEPEALHWWEVFTMVKMTGIWVSAGREYADGRNMDPIMAFAAWSAGDIQSYLLLTALGR